MDMHYAVSVHVLVRTKTVCPHYRSTRWPQIIAATTMPILDSTSRTHVLTKNGQADQRRYEDPRERKDTCAE